ncbi:hypothetical protein OG410_22360 [Streptomyces sp. NBC_00659]|uniref:DUF3592 domain-containing protein n=1 Tax=Streptomyces sp. NBC_00659 TaxID=2903669 RepID=UPI002E351435|nr:DUF3592 domain-containing protein [Streptomyces sp. NBC_00659]
MGGALVLALIMAVVSTGVGHTVVHTARRHRQARHLHASGVQTTGTCTALSWDQDQVLVRFSYRLPDGTEHEAESFPMEHTTVVPGSDVTVVYDPAAPTTAELRECLEPALGVRRRQLVGVAPIALLIAVLDICIVLGLLSLLVI